MKHAFTSELLVLREKPRTAVSTSTEPKKVSIYTAQ
eukprot:COSAG05_NODE_1898_length_3869_cov_2361.763130_4_plen_36_part_00